MFFWAGEGGRVLRDYTYGPVNTKNLRNTPIHVEVQSQ